MKKIRIGKDIALKWAILTNGEPEPLQGRDLKVIILDPLRRKTTVSDYETDGHILSFRFSGIEQKALGRYSLTLFENFGKIDMTAVDACNVFELVSSTCQEPTFDMENETVEWQSNIQIGIKGASAYEIAVENGFQGTVEEWLQSLRQPAEDAASEANTQIEAMETLEITVTKAEEQRKQTEQQRVLSETARDTAEQQRSETFTRLQNDIETLKREAGTSISNAGAATAAANQAANQATQATQSADTATRNANLATENANAAGQSIVRLEQIIKQAEQSRISAEQSRSSAETARHQAEESRVSAETARSTAETLREQQEQNRQSAEQQRVNEFKELKQESETATNNANQATQSANSAAENANKAAETVNSRLSEVYANYAAIEASGETDTNKIYIDAESNTSYRYDGTGFVSIGGAIKEVEETESDVELSPNVYYKFGEMSQLNITLAAGQGGVKNVYAFEFTSGYSPTVLSLPAYINWEGSLMPEIKPYGQYEVCIINQKASIRFFGTKPLHPNLVAAWSAKGKTNNDVDKVVLTDLTGNGHDIALNGFKFSGMSGYNGYPVDLKADYNTTLQVGIVTGILLSDKFTITSVKQVANFLENSKSRTFPSYKVKVSNVSNDLYITYIYGGGKFFYMKTDGIYTLPAVNTPTAYIGFRASKIVENCNITLEILPEYPDALCFPDDYSAFGVCENLPVLTDYTVIVKAVATNYKSADSAMLSNSYGNNSAFRTLMQNKVYSFGTATTVNTISPVSWQTTESYNGQPISRGTAIGTKYLCVGRTLHQNINHCVSGAFYCAYLFNRTLEPDEIFKFIRQYVEDTYELPTI